MHARHLVLPALLLGALACSSTSDQTSDGLDAVPVDGPLAVNPNRPRKARLQRIVVNPPAPSLAAGAAQAFAATGQMSDGTTVALTPVWSATGGTITAGGQYTAGQAAGTWRVIATQDAVADTAEVTVTVATTTVRTLVALTISPAAVSLATGSGQQFAAAARWSDGTTTAPTVTWTATGGTVSPSGWYWSGTTGGAYRVVATSAGVADTAEVTIAAPAPTPTPTPTDATVLFPNAPATGWTTIADVRWKWAMPFRRDPIYEGDNGSHMVNYGDDDPATEWGRQAFLVADAETPGAPDSTLELRMPAGLTGGYAPSKIGQHGDWGGNGPLWWSPSVTTGHLYVGFWVRFSPGYTLNGNVAQKIFYLKSDLAANRAINHMVGIMVNDGNGGNQLWPAYEPQNPFNRYQVPATTMNNLNDGRWHQLEFLQTPNTPGVANGGLTIWVDGRVEVRRTDAMYFATGQVPSVNRLEINPIYGGGSRPVPQNQWIRLGPMVVKTR